jgi:hypothetical protein
MVLTVLCTVPTSAEFRSNSHGTDGALAAMPFETSYQFKEPKIILLKLSN